MDLVSLWFFYIKHKVYFTGTDSVYFSWINSCFYNFIFTIGDVFLDKSVHTVTVNNVVVLINRDV